MEKMIFGLTAEVSEPPAGATRDDVAEALVRAIGASTASEAIEEVMPEQGVTLYVHKDETSPAHVLLSLWERWGEPFENGARIEAKELTDWMWAYLPLADAALVSSGLVSLEQDLPPFQSPLDALRDIVESLDAGGEQSRAFAEEIELGRKAIARWERRGGMRSED